MYYSGEQVEIRLDTNLNLSEFFIFIQFKQNTYYHPLFFYVF